MSAQCGQTATIVICDMTQEDIDGDTVPDGIINLQQEYATQIGGVLPAGTWFDPDFNFALNEITGDVSLWDLDNSTTVSDPITDPVKYYEFQLFTTACGTTPAYTIQLHLGPYSGTAVPATGINDINVQVCATVGPNGTSCGRFAMYDLNLILLSLPSAHQNGTWSYTGSSPNFGGVVGNLFFANIPYQPGPPLVDEEIFELIYTVPGLAPCNLSMETRVKVSVVRQVVAGAPSHYNICEDEVSSGTAFHNINLLDDAYLVDEDIEGTWTLDSYTPNQITAPDDSVISLNDLYDHLMTVNPRFGCATFGFEYSVNDRSIVCSSLKSTVSFIIFEKLRPFTEDLTLNKDFCVGESASIQLYDHLQFTTENGTLYDYPDPDCTNWTLVSGPSSLGVLSNPTVCIDDIITPPYTSMPTINFSSLTNADAGTYTFQYTVYPRYNCGEKDVDYNDPYPPETIYIAPDACGNTEDKDYPCSPPETATVTFTIHPVNYPGENTNGLEFCEGTNINSPVDLISLLNTDGIQDPIYTGTLGTWTNVDTGVQFNDTDLFTLPTITGQQTFNFIYNTDTLLPTPNGCPDEATLSFTVYEPNDPGVGTPQDLCRNNGTVNLIDLLSGNPDSNGTWIGPNGYTGSNHFGVIDTAVADSGDYTYTIPANGTCSEVSATFYVTIHQAPNTGANQTPPAVCNTVNTVDLLPLVDPTADSGGTFSSVTAGILSGSVVTVTNLTAGDYVFEYQIQGNAACSLQTSTITLTIQNSLNPGTATPVVVCRDGIAIDLFNSLSGSPNATGTWAGPGGYTAATNTAMINPSVNISGDYVYTVPANGGCSPAQVTVSLTINPAPEAGSGQTETVCQSDGIVDLNTLIDPMADAGGTFTDLSVTGVLMGDMLDVSALQAGTYNFTYELPATAICSSDIASLSVTVLTVLPPVATNQTFCVNQGATVSTLSITNTQDYNWYESATSTIALDDDIVLVNGEDYYVAAIDSNGCESSRVQITVTLLPLSSSNCDDGVGDGISDNGDGENDTLDLGGLLIAYPNFEIEIFNRYGTVVYKGNINTNPFEGSGNVSLTLGKKLPTGVYFYVFNPKDGVTEPFQGDFYLSR